VRVLVGCEFSGIVRQAFRELGHNAWSCDLLPSEDNSEFHIQDDVLNHLDAGWDLMIFQPPCTYLATMGIWWNHKRPERWELTHKALEFVDTLAKAPCERIAIENPVGYLSKNWPLFPKGPTQVVHPWQFGHEANKPTCLWLKNLPKLTPTQIVGKGEFYVKTNGWRLSKWSHGISGTKKERARNASRTFKGIAQAMAEQWTLKQA
jgi:hypothetical protein